ncbi:ThuA domain-containing protein [Streptomyces sp. GMY02]|uniref:ThuA domain-containing protein n=1 Tax=Streptomyces sp. GMY02 TaxID=1333528 RepID=UPI001C2BEB49|nr:ThuA domain-containing protein [Streptomyces sp. GMY02]QXE38814.1 ThuA domain-containing protein [Streptomyces sp. GMY02]
MFRQLRRLPSAAASAFVVALALVGAFLTPAVTAQAADPAYKVLVFSKTAGFRHDSIPAGTQAIRDLGAANNFTVTATEDSAAFTTANLAQFKTVVFLSTTGDVLNDAQQSALQSYLDGGGGYVGVHAAADTEYGWPQYEGIVGAWFKSHPAIQQATLKTEDRTHAATSHLGQTWSRSDEWYNYRTNPRANVHVLQSLDESSYNGGEMSGDHPITWCHPQGNGRSFYTGLGHTTESYADPAFRSLLLGGIRYAAGFAKADCRAETGYTPLYNGSTTGWSQAGPGSFTNTDATLTSTGGMGLYWYQAKEFKSYSLKLDWRMPGDDNSGVFVGFPSSTDPNSAVNQGYEIQIDATDTSDKTTGSIYGFKSADIAARDGALNPPGAWNTYEIRVEGERLQVFLNGVKINDFTNTDPVRSLQQGYIGIQNHGTGDDVSFRNIRIKELGGGNPNPGPSTYEGEAYTSSAGVQPADHASASGGRTLGYIENGDWAGYSQAPLNGATTFTARVSSGGAGGTLQVRSGSATGAVLGSVTIPNTGGWENFRTVSTPLTGSPTGPVFLTFTGGAGSLFDVDTFTLDRPAALDAPAKAAALSNNVHLFYYPWYGSPAKYGSYRHWQQGGRTPPQDIGADLYPKLGAYDSGDYTGAVAQHMKWVKQSGAGVIVYSWWGRGGYEDTLARGVLDAAQREGIKVAWHIEPYSGRTAASVVSDIQYLNATYGSHPAYYRDAEHNSRPAFYIFESLRITDWAALDQVTRTNSVLAQTTDTSKIAHFSGLYTYDGIAGATAPGWKQAGDYARANGLIWAPSVAPGYIDDRAVPGNTTPTLGRANGATYDKEWNNALDPAIGGSPSWVSVTSFNEWHEGSSIEPASSAPPGGFGYQTFSGAYGRTGADAENAYLDRTKYWVNQFEARRVR